VVSACISVCALVPTALIALSSIHVSAIATFACVVPDHHPLLADEAGELPAGGYRHGLGVHGRRRRAVSWSSLPRQPVAGMHISI
jgi:hypothetical protein